MFTKQRAIEFLTKNKYPKVFIDVFEDNELPTNFFIWVGVPEELYMSSDDEQKQIIPDGYEPLWDDGNFDSIYCYRKEDDSIVEVNLEGYETVFKNTMQFYSYLIYKAWESEYHDVIEQWANALNFPYLVESLEYFNNTNQDKLTLENYYYFIEKIDKTSITKQGN